jgi:ribose transport system permease protein/ribose transport system ATP-binding protein
MMPVLAAARRQQTLIPGEASARLGLAGLGVLLFVVCSLRFDTFLSTDNVLIIALNMSSIAIAVIGTSALLISGNIDLSIGSMFAFIAMTVGVVVADTQNTLLAVAVGLGMGAALGALNGGLVRLLKINPLIVTLAMLAMYGGLAFVVNGGDTVFGFPDSFTTLGRSGFGNLTTPIIVAAVVFVIVGFWLVRSRSGLRVYAIGGDARAAELNGVAVGRTVVGLYTLNGFLIGIVAVLAGARLGSASPTLGTGFELDVLTAAILGGVAFSGGAGRPLGVFFGVAVIGIINAGLLFEGLDDYYQQIAKGSLLLVALGADQLAQVRREAKAKRGAEAAPPSSVPVASDPDSGSDGSAPANGLLRSKRDPAELPDTLLEAKGITVRYGPVLALESAGITVRPGEVVALLGDNGAGKSTLIKVLSGAEHQVSGDLRLRGEPVTFRTPHDARAAGLETVYQDLALCPNLSVAHNLVLGDEPTRRWLGLIPVRDDRAASEQASTQLGQLGINLTDVRVPVDRLSGGQRQSVAIARAVRKDVAVVLLDEPTAALGVAQTRNVLNLVRAVAARGTGVVFISHDIESVYQVANQVVVLRLGKVVHSGSVNDLSQMELLHLMAGFHQETGEVPAAPGEPSAWEGGR